MYLKVLQCILSDYYCCSVLLLLHSITNLLGWFIITVQLSPEGGAQVKRSMVWGHREEKVGKILKTIHSLEEFQRVHRFL